MDEECATEVKNQGEWGACELSEDTLRRGKWSAAAGVAERLGERERLEVSVAVSNAAVTEKWTSPQFFFFFFCCAGHQQRETRFLGLEYGFSGLQVARHLCMCGMESAGGHAGA